MASIQGKIRDRTDRRYARLPLEWAVEDLNRALRGWGNYFRYGNSARKFAHIESYVNERLPARRRRPPRLGLRAGAAEAARVAWESPAADGKPTVVLNGGVRSTRKAPSGGS